MGVMPPAPSPPGLQIPQSFCQWRVIDQNPVANPVLFRSIARRRGRWESVGGGGHIGGDTGGDEVSDTDGHQGPTT